MKPTVLLLPALSLVLASALPVAPPLPPKRTRRRRRLNYAAWLRRNLSGAKGLRP